MHTRDFYAHLYLSRSVDLSVRVFFVKLVLFFLLFNVCVSCRYACSAGCSRVVVLLWLLLVMLWLMMLPHTDAAFFCTDAPIAHKALVRASKMSPDRYLSRLGMAISLSVHAVERIFTSPKRWIHTAVHARHHQHTRACNQRRICAHLCINLAS